ncbi:MAG: hypothetical protein RMK30_06605 [Anaerolineae bacterium]|nr:hypothetical protein [Anaerolineae bacterium]
MKLFFTDRPVPPDSPAYVERSADIKIRHLILQNTPVYLSAPPLTGKTSLLFRLGFFLLPMGFSFFYLRLSQETSPEELDSFLRDCSTVSARCVLIVDNVEKREGLLLVLRRWLYQHPDTPLVAAGTFLPYPGEISPLVEIALGFFYRPHVLQLVNLLGLKGEEARRTLEAIYYWSGGYPYIVQSLCAALAEGQSLEEAVEGFTRHDRNLLPTLREALLGTPEALDLYKRILKGERISYRQTVPLVRRVPALGALFRSDEKGFTRLSSPLLSCL